MATPGLFPPGDEEEGVPQKIFLPASLWSALTEISDFESEVRRAAKFKGYSRAKLIRHALSRYAAEYWPGVGGKPENPAEAKRMAEREAERRIAEAEERHDEEASETPRSSSKKLKPPQK